MVAEPVAFDQDLEGHRRHGDDLGRLVRVQRPNRYYSISHSLMGFSTGGPKDVKLGCEKCLSHE